VDYYQVRRDCPEMVNDPQETALPPPMKRFRLLAQDALSRAGAARGVPDIDQELATYTASAAAAAQCSSTSTIDFWMANTSALSALAPLALDLVSATASQVYVERVFSVCGEITARKRKRLSKNLYTRVFLKMNNEYY